MFFFCCRRRHFFLKLSLCKGVLFLLLLLLFQCYALFSCIIADGWVFFFFSHTVGEGFFFSKIFYLLEVKWCIPKGWHVGSYLEKCERKGVEVDSRS